MAKRISPLSPVQANRSLVHRLSPIVDRLRQRLTNFGLRSRRVFLVWTVSDACERGDGNEAIQRVVEVLPTPKVSDLNTVTRNPFSAGTLPAGTIRVDRISAQFSEALLRGRTPDATDGLTGKPIEEPHDFFYEVVDDGRSDLPVSSGVGCGNQQTDLIPVLGASSTTRMRFRLLGRPHRRPGAIDWTIFLERESEDRAASGRSNIGGDE